MFVWLACRSLRAHSRNDSLHALHKFLSNEVFDTFIVKLIDIVCPTESYIGLPVYVLVSKLFAAYGVQIQILWLWMHTVFFPVYWTCGKLVVLRDRADEGTFSG
jgi:hypothetical protein